MGNAVYLLVYYVFHRRGIRDRMRGGGTKYVELTLCVYIIDVTTISL